MPIQDVFGNGGSQMEFSAASNGKFFKIAPESGGGTGRYVKVNDVQGFDFTTNGLQSFTGGTQIVVSQDPTISLDF